MKPMIVDAHLDLAYNALRGREVLRPANEQTGDEDGTPTVGLPDLRNGGVGLVCATIFAEPSIDGKRGYVTPDEAHAAGRAQFEWYAERLAWFLRRRDRSTFRFVSSSDELPEATPVNDPFPMILLMEGADPIRTPAEVPWWFNYGLRIVALSWKRTRYAGGTGAPGPLTSEGIALVRALDAVGIIHDVSHLAEESFWQLLDVSGGPVIASHSNCRAIVPTDRQLSDEMIRAIARRDGVIGINFFDKFLLPPAELLHRRATLADVARHVRHMCDLIGDAAHVGLGTDMDGGFGREHIPEEIATSADLPRVGDALSQAGFGDEEVRGIMGENWIGFFQRVLGARE